jgi:hypothetical protein
MSHTPYLKKQYVTQQVKAMSHGVFRAKLKMGRWYLVFPSSGTSIVTNRDPLEFLVDSWLTCINAYLMAKEIDGKLNMEPYFISSRQEGAPNISPTFDTPDGLFEWWYENRDHKILWKVLTSLYDPSRKIGELASPSVADRWVHKPVVHEPIIRDGYSKVIG